MSIRDFGIRVALATESGLARLGRRLHTAEDRGASAVEYALLVALIAVVIIVAVRALGGALSTRFTEVASAVATAS